MKITVLHSRWAAEGEEFPSGTHELVKPSKQLLRCVAGAETAGVITVDATDEERAALTGHVEANEASLDKLAAAQEDGSWHHGNLLQFVAATEDRLAYDDTLGDWADDLDARHEDKLAPEERARHERDLLATRGEIDAIEAAQ